MATIMLACEKLAIRFREPLTFCRFLVPSAQVNYLIQVTVCTHAVVIVGIESNGEYLIADPYRSAQPLTVPRERLVAALAAAQFCCESAILVIEGNN
jgi:hypothetical protein